ncbi:DUF1588 domain-containing protein [Thalassoroseus pseudoceratinae]|uniref:DUF1588 domain-containing protein n=1 Tax=Thalassoroseus pseudoceratinae TaxID=2713176 RepID=UPI001422D914|nr:DUF1588 domain-containing protein [Thalassoroseus pseudoceratinae]
MPTSQLTSHTMEMPIQRQNSTNAVAVSKPFLKKWLGTCRNLALTTMFVFLALTLNSVGHASETDVVREKGARIWNSSCVDCHGENGEGVGGIYELPLIGDETAGQLAKVISETMPKDDPKACLAEDAQAVAEWMHHTFYSEAARLRNRPPRIELTHLTNNQLRQSLADLFGYSRGSMWRENKHGVNANYFDGSRWKRENLKIERVDPYINFDWGKDSPGEGISSEAFYVNWRTGLKVNETGRYEIVVRSTAAFRMRFGAFDRLFIDNHVQSGDKTEFRKSIFLLAGRVYPVQIELYQRKRKTEQPPVTVSLSWVTPHGTEEVIPNRHLLATSPPPTFALQAKLPPDDRSYGFDRGLNVDRTWDEATTGAAVEFSKIASEELWGEYLKRHRKDGGDDRAKLQAFLTELAELAFRGPLSEREKQFYIADQLNASEDNEIAMKRSLLTILKSPRFLYPDLDRDRTKSRRVANRLALILFDSLPTDRNLLEAAEKGQLESDQQIREMAGRMVRDYRCEGKTRDMLFEWLNLSHLGAIEKNSDQYADFSGELVADLRKSLEATLEDAVLRADGDFRDLFRPEANFTTASIASFYGDAWSLTDESTTIEGDLLGLQPIETLVKIPAKAPFDQGVLSHPYLMSGLAYSDTTSPIHRGVFLMRYMLGRMLQPPQEAFTPFSPDLHPNLTTRERVALQTGGNTCQVCHSKINPLGFTLENFDTVGRFRKQEIDRPIVSTGSYIDRSGQEVSFSGPADLAEYLATSNDAHEAFVSRVFQHFVKQPIAAYGAETQQHLTQKFVDADFNLHQLLVEIAVIATQPPVATLNSRNISSK